MRILRKSLLAGAVGAQGVVILVDAFRAGNTAAALLQSGAPFVVPVSSLEEARTLKRAHSDWLLAGERQRMKPPDFDMDNSPADAMELNLKGRPVVLTTSAGTQGIVAAASTADVLMMVTLVNGRAAVRLIQDLSPSQVTIVALGLSGIEPAEEDEAVADYLVALLNRRQPDVDRTLERMRKSPGAAHLKKLGKGRDLDFCLELDRLPLVPLVCSIQGRRILLGAEQGNPFGEGGLPCASRFVI